LGLVVTLLAASRLLTLLGSSCQPLQLILLLSSDCSSSYSVRGPQLVTQDHMSHMFLLHHAVALCTWLTCSSATSTLSCKLAKRAVLDHHKPAAGCRLAPLQ
jgi:hypothetical protein